jgi:biopolymer transport protein TolR
MAMNVSSVKSGCAVINVTPMIDILLVLLIVFMAIAPQKAVGLDALLPLPDRSTINEAPEDPVVLEIDASGRYRLNTMPVQIGGLAERLSGIYSRRAERVLFVKAAPALEFHTVADAIDIAHGVAVDRVALLPR